MPSIPQSMYVNPATFPTSRINVGLPVLSSVYLHASNSAFSWNDMFEKRADDSITFAFGKLIDKMKDKNLLNISFQTDLLSFGFVVKKKNYFSFNATEKINVLFHYPKDLLKFFWYGNAPYLGEDINFNFAADISHYREYALGYAREINEKLNVGGKVKYLYGMENIDVKKANISIYTDPNTNFPMTFTSDIEVNTSGVDTNATNNFDVGSYLFKRKNTGLALDLGANYKITEKISISASVLDLGYIKWKDSPTSHVSKNPGASYTFTGVDVNMFLGNSNNSDSLMGVTLDSIQDRFELVKKHDTYKTNLQTKIYVGANYKIYDKNTAGILFSAMTYNGTMNPAVTVFDNQRVGNWLSVCLSYSMMNRSFGNLGFGFSMNSYAIQYYAVSDNILSVFMPNKTRNANIRFGINYTFGRKDPDKDGDKVADLFDECPDVKGPVELKGCPDKDGDKVPDKLDRCPDIAGDPAKEGCPDKDGDGVHDFEDACPDSVGTVAMKGCPDKDGDKIADKDDECPDQPGIEKFRGCPDTDGDGLKDKLDLCPDKAGPEKNGGCPEAKLNLLDKNGNPTISTEKASDGGYKFDVLPPDSIAAFKLENVDPLPASIFITQGGVAKTAYKESDNTYRFAKAITNTVDETLRTTGQSVIPVAPTTPVAAPDNKKPNVVEPKATPTTTPSQSVQQKPQTINEQPKPIETTKPVEVSKPVETPKPTEQVKTTAIVTPPAASQTQTNHNAAINTAPTMQLSATQKQAELSVAEKAIAQNAYSNLEFEKGFEWILESSFDELDALVDLIKKHPTWKIKFGVVTTEKGDALKNQELAKKRSDMIRKYFTLKGIHANRIETETKATTYTDKPTRVEIIIFE